MDRRATRPAFVLSTTLIAAAALPGCSFVTGMLPTALPATRPADFAFQYDSTGGMRDDSETLDCDARRCLQVRHRDGQGWNTTRTPSAAQLDTVYAAFRNARFDRLRTESHGMVSDAASVSITLRAQGRELSFARGATEGVAEHDGDRFNAVGQAIHALSQSLFPEPPRGGAPTQPPA